MNIFIENITYCIIDNFYTIKNYIYLIFLNCIEHKIINNIIEEKYEDTKATKDIIIEIKDTKDSFIEINDEWAIIEENDIDSDVFYNIGKYLIEEEAQIIYKKST